MYLISSFSRKKDHHLTHNQPNISSNHVRVYGALNRKHNCHDMFHSIEVIHFCHEKWLHSPIFGSPNISIWFVVASHVHTSLVYD
jgi:hypothetical protein